MSSVMDKMAEMELQVERQNARETPMMGSAWNGAHLILGIYHLWVDGSGRLRIKSSAPAGDTDGTIVGVQS